MLTLRDLCGRKIDYLRISITDRCNLRCQYCMPPDGIIQKSHKEIVSYEEIIRIVSVATELGIRKVRITGGEPLARLGVVDFIRQLSHVEGLEDISMTTNGILLAQHAAELKAAGLNRVNISLDSLKRERFAEITRRDHLEQVLAGIQMALDVGLDPVKLNVVAMRNFNDDEIMDFVALTKEYPLHVRFIEFMPLGQSKASQSEQFISLEEVRDKINQEVVLEPIGVKQNGPAQCYTFAGSKGSVGFITPISHKFCAECNRLRLTADGKLRPCLDNNLEIDLQDETGEIGDQDYIRTRFIEALRLKPDHHNFLEEREDISTRNMFQIGG